MCVIQSTTTAPLCASATPTCSHRHLYNTAVFEPQILRSIETVKADLREGLRFVHKHQTLFQHKFVRFQGRRTQSYSDVYGCLIIG